MNEKICESCANSDDCPNDGYIFSPFDGCDADNDYAHYEPMEDNEDDT